MIIRPDHRSRPPVLAQALEGFTEVIEAWLSADARRPRKQRHTARRVFDRLVTEQGYTGSYSPVQRYIKAHKAVHRTRGEGFQELVCPRGAAQVDFGQAQAIIAGVAMMVHVLVVTFPYSNMRLVQAYRGETAECVCHGLRVIFEHINSAPRQLIFDNATGIGRRTGTTVIESKLFGSIKAHYRCQVRYCNPDSGHEKGNVENAVGFLRRNLMVPEPEAQSIEGLNQILLARCAALAEEDHYRNGIPIRQLFEEDIAACLELPGVGFDPVRYESLRTDKGRESKPREDTLGLDEREEISRGIAAGDSVRRIACRLGRAASTISREINKNKNAQGYRAVDAHDRALRRAQRPQRLKLQKNPVVRNYVAARLQQDWSPEQIAGRLLLDYPDNPRMHISHEAIYRAVYLNCGHKALPHHIHHHLRRHRPLRHSRYYTTRGQWRSQITNARPISHRPAAANQRAEPGHFEGDLIVGSKNSQVATLVDRRTRETHIIQLNDRSAQSVTTQLTRHLEDCIR